MDFSEKSPGQQPSSSSEESSRDLGSRFVRRDPAAFEEVYRRFREAVYVIGVLELGDPEEAQDLVQETFRRAWSAAPTLDDPSRIRSWLLAIARNLCVDLAKKAMRRPRVMQDLSALRVSNPETGPLPDAIRQEKARHVQTLIASIPEKFRLVLAMRMLQEKSYQEIAETLDIPLHGVKNAIARGGRILWEKVQMSPDLDGEDES